MKRFLSVFLSLITAAVLAVCIGGCGANPVKEGNPSATSENASATPGNDPEETPADVPETTEEPAATPVKSSLPLHPETSTEQMTTPFWLTDTMYNETICFHQQKDGTVKGTTVFTPVEIVSLTDYTLKKTYKEGTDFIWDGTTNTITLPEGSPIKFFTEKELKGYDEKGKQLEAFSGTFDAKGRSRLANALFCNSEYLYGRQYAITYKYSFGSWTGPLTEFQGDVLPKTTAKLKNGEDIKVTFFGDSIFAGAEASAYLGHAPGQPVMATLFKKAIEAYYSVKVSINNPSIGGLSSKDLMDHIGDITKSSKRIPDLVFIGFGMNDQTTVNTGNNAQKVIDEVLKVNPDCEFVLVTTMKPNPDSGMLQGQPRIPSLYKPLLKQGVGYVDMYGMHTAILETKDYVSTSGNNVNHPNDWLIRIYVMNLCAALIDY